MPSYAGCLHYFNESLVSSPSDYIAGKHETESRNPRHNLDNRATLHLEFPSLEKRFPVASHVPSISLGCCTDAFGTGSD